MCWSTLCSVRYKFIIPCIPFISYDSQRIILFKPFPLISQLIYALTSKNETALMKAGSELKAYVEAESRELSDEKLVCKLPRALQMHQAIFCVIISMVIFSPRKWIIPAIIFSSCRFFWISSHCYFFIMKKAYHFFLHHKSTWFRNALKSLMFYVFVKEKKVNQFGVMTLRGGWWVSGWSKWKVPHHCWAKLSHSPMGLFYSRTVQIITFGK